MDAAIKKIPYGLTDFERIIRENYYYVDKTQYIARVEDQASYFFIVRPRRFGKSLFLNMLANYYDINKKDRFEEIFGGLYIGKHPTPARNKYMVLNFNFSNITSNHKNPDEIFNTYCKLVINTFAKDYSYILGDTIVDEIKEYKTADALLGFLCLAAQSKGQKIYITIDEIDMFANNMLINCTTNLIELLRGFLNVMKDYSSSVIERIFFTGINPVTLDDLSSGFNIADNYSCNSVFNNMIGFSELNVRTLIEYYRNQMEFPHTTDELIKTMRSWYGNYYFSTYSLNEPSMYNPDMVLYFMNHYLINKVLPDSILSPYINTDYNEMQHFININKTYSENANIVKEIIEKGFTNGIIADSFPAEDIVKLENFKSLLYYNGMLTIKGIEMGEPILSIPNLTVRKQLDLSLD